MKNLSFAVACLLLCAGTLAADVQVSLHGPSSPVGVGSVFALDVNISGVSDLAYFQFDVGFDPTVANATLVTEGAFLPSAGPTLFIPGTIDNTAGLVSFIADALTGAGQGATGDGVLARINFSALREGTGAFTLLSPLFYDSVPNPIDVRVADTTVTAVAAPVPEPSTVFLLGGSVVALAFCRRRFRAKR